MCVFRHSPDVYTLFSTNYYYFLFNSSDGHAVMQLIDPDKSYDRSSVERKISFLWKTDALRGIVQVSEIVNLGALTAFQLKILL